MAIDDCRFGVSVLDLLAVQVRKKPIKQRSTLDIHCSNLLLDRSMTLRHRVAMQSRSTDRMVSCKRTK